MLEKLVEITDQEPSLLMEGLRASGKEALLQALSQKRNVLLISLHDFALPGTLEFPAWETLPGEEILPSPDIVGKRLWTLYKLLEGTNRIVTTPLQAVLQKLLSQNTLVSLCKIWKKGDPLAFDSLPQELVRMGYKRAPVVSDKGEFAVRGGILDIFPLSSPDPYRLDFFGDTLDGIRTFDPVGQKSISKVEEIFIPPAGELEFLKKEKTLENLLDYLPENTLVIFDDLLALEDKYVEWQKMPAFRSSFFTPFEEFFQKLKSRIYWTKTNVEELSEIELGPRAGRKFYASGEVLQPLSFEFLHQKIGTKRFSPTFLETLPQTETAPAHKTKEPKWRSTYHTPPSEFHELSPGDIVVHFHQGIGKYLGIQKKPNHLGLITEFMEIEFAEKSTLFVPISQSYLISRYIGSSEEIPTLSMLGTQKWTKQKLQAQKAIIGYAQDLLRLNAEREIQGGFACPEDSSDTLRFEEEFPFVETEDQLRAIHDIKKDLCSKKGMDRLICGDVGYGKTEVAMRAAFKAVVDGKKQVAVLVPTTVLAMQHFDTFSERMKGFPINISVVSRFRSAKEIKETLKKTETGGVDILIGTHRLISKDVKFHDLGLIIIDEEQRFGVRAKEHLKALKTGVDCLTLSATPIPRTLYLSLIGAREISVINTPPQNRLPIKSIIAEKNPELVQNALMRELSRDGQIFFVHNKVETIFLVANELQKLVPQARIAVGHGQMSAEELDAVFHAFKGGEADVLVATTIIENGIDIPNANTILIDRADTFGLADLYQMRGRVGRWNKPAYAYFLVPEKRSLSEHSRKRLFALVESSGYGGGMKIAMRDLEIRGAGDILGTEQSGQISNIGFHLYCKLLKRTVDALQKKVAPSFTETKVEFPYDARLPEEYIGESSLRLEIYYRLGEAMSFAEVDEIFAELKDRFGPTPPQVIWLYHLTRIRTSAMQHKVSLLKIGSHTIEIEWPTGKRTFPFPKMTKPEEIEAFLLKAIEATNIS